MDPATVTVTHPPMAQATGSRARRWIGAIVAAGSASLLGLAAWMQPAADGLGTHTQLNLPPCAWIAAADIPCPTCGMTTAFAHAAHGHLLASAQAQPLGFLLALATGIVLLVGLYTAATGSRVAGAFARLWGRRTGWLVAALVLGAWAYKIITYKGLL